MEWFRNDCDTKLKEQQITEAQLSRKYYQYEHVIEID